MKKLIILLSIGALAYFGFRALATDSETATATPIDGDTYHVCPPSQPCYRLRLAQIDCPELSQPFGNEAKSYAYRLVYGKAVGVKTSGKDKYGRTLGDLYLNGVSVSLLLAQEGYAWAWNGTASANVQKAVKQAREARKGLWADPNPQSPYHYRKTHPKP